MSGDLPTPDEVRDQVAALRAAVDQSVASMAQMAEMVAAYFNGLVAQGFTRSEALALTICWQRDALLNPPRPEGDS